MSEKNNSKIEEWLGLRINYPPHIQLTIRKSISKELGVFCLINKGIYHLNIFIELWFREILIGMWGRKEYIKNEQKKREIYILKRRRLDELKK